jgi:hypothetical protein
VSIDCAFPARSTDMKRRIRHALLAACTILPLTGCGTLLFEERHGQDGGKLDPNVIVLDGVGLFFFIVPGLIAYLVDLSTGAIYLPPGVEGGEGPFFH